MDNSLEITHAKQNAAVGEQITKSDEDSNGEQAWKLQQKYIYNQPSFIIRINRTK